MTSSSEHLGFEVCSWNIIGQSIPLKYSNSPSLAGVCTPYCVLLRVRGRDTEGGSGWGVGTGDMATLQWGETHPPVTTVRETPCPCHLWERISPCCPEIHTRVDPSLPYPRISHPISLIPTLYFLSCFFSAVQQVVASVKNIQKLVAELRWPDRTFAEHLSCR